MGSEVVGSELLGLLGHYWLSEQKKGASKRKAMEATPSIKDPRAYASYVHCPAQLFYTLVSAQSIAISPQNPPPPAAAAGGGGGTSISTMSSSVP